MRQIILSVLGVALVVLAFLGMKTLGKGDDTTTPQAAASLPKVFVQDVNNTDIAVNVSLTGRLEAVDKVDLYSETQGIFRSPKKFRPGTSFNKGQTIISVNSAQEVANLKAQRSNLVNQIVRFLPDLKFDYAESFSQWESYIANFDVKSTTPSLPNPLNEREKFFVAGQGVHSIYYQIKNLESRLSKYRIYAPFTGVLAQTFVNEGAMISPGQKLATLIGKNAFELVLPVREEYISFVKVGQELSLKDKEGNRILQGKLARVNPSIDPSTQTVNLYIIVSGKDLREGMFLEANLPLQPIENAMEINRKLVVDNKFVFGVNNDELVKVPISPVHYNEETVVIKGLQAGQSILSKMLPGAREGMKIEIIKE